MMDDTGEEKIRVDTDQNANGGLDIPADADADEAVTDDKKFDYGTGGADEGTVPVAE